MGGTRIMVVQLKEVIKSAVFVVVGLVLIILLIYFFIPREKQTPSDSGSSAALYNPGTYSAQIVLHNNPVDVLVTLSADRIEDIALSNMAETQEVFYPLFEPTLEDLSLEILSNQTLEVSDSGENTITRKILLDAISMAVAQGEY